jgi:hypothetical protein
MHAADPARYRGGRIGAALAELGERLLPRAR